MNFTLQVRSSLIALAGAALVLSGCPTVPNPDPLEASPVISTFTASAPVVDVGAKVTLSWKVENATSLKIEEPSLGAVSGVSGNEGSVEVAITVDSIFVLTARNDRGATDTAVVSVRAGAASREILFTALPGSIAAGGSATLAWSAPGVTAVTVTANPGGALDLQGQTVSGVITVSPTLTTEYTLTAGGRSVTATVAVEPTLSSFTATPLSALPGQSVTLAWTTVNAARVVLSAPGRGTLADGTDAMGTFTETLPAQADPGQLFPYELTVTGAGQTIKRSVLVSISGKPAVATFTAPALARSPSAGVFPDGGTPVNQITLAWTTLAADAVSLSTGGVEFYRAPTASVAAGNVVLPTPAQTTTYLLTASDDRGGVATRSVTVEVRGIPTVALTATPGSVTAGTPVTLAWTGQNIFNAVISESTFGGLVYANSGQLDTGSTQASPNANVTYTIVADNGLGDRATSSADVTSTGQIALSVAETGALRSGQNVTVSWTTPTAAPIVGLGHDQVDVRTASTGFEDITLTGQKLTFVSERASITTNFRTVLFGRSVGEVITVTDNGYLTFGVLNGTNSTDVALPTAKIEAMSIAPYWESMSGGDGVFWQVKQLSGVPTLIVQWKNSTADFEAKIASSGQVDFEYRTLPTTVNGNSGVVGAIPAQTVVLPVTPAANLGVTFFGPRPSPVSVRAVVEGPIGGHLNLGVGQLLRVSASLPLVVDPSELTINEVMPASTVGPNGAWVELRNARDRALPLTGWSFALSDGGAIALSGSVPPRGLLVVGASTDPALNDDAGVQVQLNNFDLSGQSTLTLARGGPHDVLSLAGADAGVAFSNDRGPYLYSGSTPAGSVRCIANETYGAGTQRGTPGVDRGCGFGYALASASPGYFDISDGGTPLLTTSFDEVLVAVDVSSAPIPYFGTPMSNLEVCTNGFVSFDPDSSATFSYLTDRPSTSDSNLLVAAFGADLTTASGRGQMYSKRIVANEDPFAAAPHWIFQWHHYRRFNVTNDDLNFQLKFFDDGIIEVHFDTMLSGSSAQYGSGTDSVTWLENAAGDQALSINANSASPGIVPFSAFRFVPR